MANERQSVSAPRTFAVLCVDDHAPGLVIRKTLLESCGYTVLTATTGAEALKIAECNRLDAAVLDYRMPDMDGLQLARALRAKCPSLPLIVLSGYVGQLPNELVSLAEVCISKGFHPTDLRDALRSVLGTEPRPRRVNTPADSWGSIEQAMGTVERSRAVVEESKKTAQKAADAIARHRERRRA